MAVLADENPPARAPDADRDDREHAGRTWYLAASTQAPAAPGAEAPTAETAVAPNRTAVIAAAPHIKIETPSVDGTISLKGARIDDLTLLNYRETTDPKSPPITLLSPPVGTGDGAYYAEFGWVADRAPRPCLPTATRSGRRAATR